MKTIVKIASLFVLCVYFSSCTTTLYTSNAVNVPLMREKGEVKFNLTQNDLQAAGAITNNIGLMANGHFKNYKDGNYKHGGYLGEAGIGYFKPVQDNPNLIFETYGGLGMGHVYKQQEFSSPGNGQTYLGKFETDAGKLFIQPSIGYASRYFDLAFTPRFSMIKYMNFSAEAYPENQLRDDYLYNNELTRSPYFFAEPAITIRGGYKYVKLQAQYGLTLNLGNRIRHEPTFGSMGLIFDLAKWYK
ncbi:MAG TPA: hypothetical protein VGF30_08755 [Bacteroidia bacterium]